MTEDWLHMYDSSLENLLFLLLCNNDVNMFLFKCNAIHVRMNFI